MFVMYIAETICLSKKAVEEEKGEEGGELENEEEMEEVKEGGVSGRGLGIRDKWMSSHEISPLAIHLITNTAVRPLHVSDIGATCQCYIPVCSYYMEHVSAMNLFSTSNVFSLRRD